jgi:hypothetical protein
MERDDSSKVSRSSEEVDGPLAAQCRRVEDWAFIGSDHVLNTGGLLASGLLRIAAVARFGPSEPGVKEAEERALADTVAVDVEERVDALIKQLEDDDRHGVRTYSSSCFQFLLFFAFV